MNNPLTAIRLLSEMLVSMMPDEETARDVRDILEATDLAAMTIESLGALAKLDGELPTPMAVPVDLGALATEVARRPALREHLRLDASAGLYVRADPNQLKQAITDILLNGRRLWESTGSSPRARIWGQGQRVLMDVELPEDSLVSRDWPDLIAPYHAVDLRDARVQVSATGLSYALSAANEAGGSLALAPVADGAVLRLDLPRASMEP